MPGGRNAISQAQTAMAELQRLASLDAGWDWSRCAVIAWEWSYLYPLRSLCEPNPMQKALRDSSAVAWRNPTTLPPSAPELARHYRQLNLKDVYLSFAGQKPPANRVHRAIAALSPNDPLQVRQQPGRWELLDRAGVVVGKLSQRFESPEGMTCTGATVLTIATWGRKYSEPQYERQLQCDTWEVVVPELTFTPS